MKICEYCGQELYEGTLECPGCGSRSFKHKCSRCGELYSGSSCPTCDPAARGRERICPNCHKVSYQNFCPACGTNLDAAARLDATFDVVFRNAGSGAGSTDRSRTKKSYSKHNKLYVILGVAVACYFSIPVIYKGLTMPKPVSIVMGPETGDPHVWAAYPDTTEGAWQQDQYGWWYANPDGSYTVNDYQMIDGEIYHFNEDGYMTTGWLEAGRDKWIYLNEDGSMARDQWIVDENREYYYVQGDGFMAVNARLRSDEDGIIYNLDSHGRRSYGGKIDQ